MAQLQVAQVHITKKRMFWDSRRVQEHGVGISPGQNQVPFCYEKERKLGATLCKNESKTGMTCQNDGLMWMVVKHRTSLILKYHKRPTTWIPKWTRQTTWTPKMKKSSTKLLYQDFPWWFVTLTWISCSNSHWRALARPKSMDAPVLQPQPNSQQIPAFLCRSISPAVKIEKTTADERS